MFATAYDVNQHMQRGCPENDDSDCDGIPMKRAKHSDSLETDSDLEDEVEHNKVFKEMWSLARECNNRLRLKKINTSVNQGMNMDEAKQKANETLLPRDKKRFCQEYGKVIKRILSLNNCEAHREIVKTAQRMRQKGLGSPESKAIQKHSHTFNELFEDTVSDDDDDDDGGDDDDADDEQDEEETEEEEAEEEDDDDEEEDETEEDEDEDADDEDEENDDNKPDEMPLLNLLRRYQNHRL